MVGALDMVMAVCGQATAAFEEGDICLGRHEDFGSSRKGIRGSWVDDGGR